MNNSSLQPSVREVDANSSLPGRRVTVCFVPFDFHNPYQPALAAHLKRYGVDVIDHYMVKGLIPRILKGASAPELIHMHWLPKFPDSAIGALRRCLFLLRILVLRLLGRRIIWTVHNMYSHETSSINAERKVTGRVINAASRIIVHSQTAQRLVVQEFKECNKSKLAVIPHGNYIECYDNRVSAVEARKMLGVDSGATMVLFLGNIRPYKGVLELVESFQNLEDSRFILIIAGKPLDSSTVDELNNAIRGNPRIQLRAGFVPDEELQVYMNACDAVVFPYRDILTSGAVILAMSFGRACIAPAIGCIQDVLDPAGAFLYDPQDPKGLRSALEQALSQRGRLEEMGAYNRKRAEAWGWDGIARQTAALYAEALGRPGPVNAPKQSAV